MAGGGEQEWEPLVAESDGRVAGSRLCPGLGPAWAFEVLFGDDRLKAVPREFKKWTIADEVHGKDTKGLWYYSSEPAWSTLLRSQINPDAAWYLACVKWLRRCGNTR
jgi:hypothetical protein